MVVEDILGEVHVAPLALVPTNDPPEDASYHLTVPELTTALKSTVPVPHLSPSVPLETVGIVFTVAVTAVLAADAQVPFNASA